MSDYWPILIVSLVVGLFVYWVLSALFGRNRVQPPWQKHSADVAPVQAEISGPNSGSDGPSEIERGFRNAFAIMTDDRRESIIEYYATKHGCTRAEAMRRAVEERRRDEDRW